MISFTVVSDVSVPARARSPRAVLLALNDPEPDFFQPEKKARTPFFKISNETSPKLDFHQEKKIRIKLLNFERNRSDPEIVLLRRQKNAKIYFLCKIYHFSPIIERWQ